MKRKPDPDETHEGSINVARPQVRPSHIHDYGPRRGRWCPAPDPRALKTNPVLGPGVPGRGARSDPAESQWALRWRNAVTGRQNYVLLADGSDTSRLFDAAARFGEDLASVREVIARDVLDRRSACYREAVYALKADVGHFGMGAPTGTVQSAFIDGEKDLVRAVKACPTRGQPREDEVNAYLEQVQPGLTVTAMHCFHATRFALPAVHQLRRYLKQRRLSCEEVVFLLVGFRPEGMADPLLTHARALGCPEARYPTRERGVVHLCGGVVGRVAAQMWNTLPVASLVGPASLYVDFLREAGALEAAEELLASEPPGDPELAVCELNQDWHMELRRGVEAEESAANDWFWEQKRRPSPSEELLLEGLVRRAAVPLQDSIAPAGVTLRAASRKNRVVVVPPKAAESPGGSGERRAGGARG